MTSQAHIQPLSGTGALFDRKKIPLFRALHRPWLFFLLPLPFPIVAPALPHPLHCHLLLSQIPIHLPLHLNGLRPVD